MSHICMIHFYHIIETVIHVYNTFLSIYYSVSHMCMTQVSHMGMTHFYRIIENVTHMYDIFLSYLLLRLSYMCMTHFYHHYWKCHTCMTHFYHIWYWQCHACVCMTYFYHIHSYHLPLTPDQGSQLLNEIWGTPKRPGSPDLNFHFPDPQILTNG